jgi:hypothetical protein
MKSLVFLGLAAFAAAGVLDARGACAADNCLRALTGTGSNEMATRRIIAASDCQSYLLAVATSTSTPITA